MCQCQQPQPARSGGGLVLLACAIGLLMFAPPATAIRGQMQAGVLGGLQRLPKLPLIGQPAQPGRPGEPRLRPGPASRAAKADIPARYLALYQRAGRRYDIPWPVLAGIGKVESDHGRSGAPGVRSGVNAFGCCAGPMQFNLRNGPPSTWDTYGRGNPYDPADAIPAAGRKLATDKRRTGSLRGALLAYNNSSVYVANVLAQARRYGWRG